MATGAPGTARHGVARSRSTLLLLLCALLCSAAPAQAREYVSVKEAQRLMFPAADRFHEMPRHEVQALLAAAAQRLPAERYSRMRPRLWSAWQGDTLLGHFVTDAVIGKFEHIDYAVALTPDATVRNVQVLVYRESHGGEVRAPHWLAQFTGATPASALRPGRDIDNITGATLSCSHLTDGIRRVVHLLAGSDDGRATP